MKKAGIIPIHGDKVMVLLTSCYADFPKGSIRQGETERECALREYNEEVISPRTRSSSDELVLIRDFREVIHYGKGSERIDLTLFLGVVRDEDLRHGEEHVGLQFMLHPEETRYRLYAERYKAVRRAFNYYTKWSKPPLG